MPFKKGQSGNPAGRKPGSVTKATVELRALAGKYSKDAIEGLVRIARTSESDSARVSAWREILDRYAGKAPQAVTDADGGNLPTIPAAIAFVVRQQTDATNRT
jgi:hypothetical protein